MQILADSDPVRQDGFSRQARAALEARGLGIRLHLADVALERIADQPWSALAPAARAMYDGRGALALNTGDVALLERAVEDVAVILRTRCYQHVPTFPIARELAAQAVAAWIASMSGDKGRRP